MKNVLLFLHIATIHNIFEKKNILTRPFANIVVQFSFYKIVTVSENFQHLNIDRSHCILAGEFNKF